MGFTGVFVQAFLVGFSGAVAPGPLLTYNIQLTFKKGFWVGPKLIVGHAVLEALLIIAMIAGLGRIIQLPVIRIVLWTIGGLLLAWMGYELIWKETHRDLPSIDTPFKNSPATGAADQSVTEELSATHEAGINIANLPPVLAGALISIINPYWVLWWVMIGLGMITQAMALGWWGVLIFYSGHILSDFLWYSFISGAIAKGRRFLSAGAYRWLLRICGIFLFFIATTFLWDAMKTVGVTNWLGQTVMELLRRFQ